MKTVIMSLAALGLLSIGAGRAQADLLVGSYSSGQILRYDQNTGQSLGVFNNSGVSFDSFVFGPDGNIYANADAATLQTWRINGTTGASMGVFASSPGGSRADGIAFGKDDTLYVANYGTTGVFRFNGTTGAFKDIIAAGVQQPTGISFGPDGNLYVADSHLDNIQRFNGTTGAFIDVFASGGGLSRPQDPIFGPDGKLYVNSYSKSEVLRYNGTTGAFIDTFVPSGSGGLKDPIDMLFGPDGNLYITSRHTANVLRYNGSTGAFIDAFASGGGLAAPYGLQFTPDAAVPEPATISLFAIGSVVLLCYGRRRKAQMRHA